MGIFDQGFHSIPLDQADQPNALIVYSDTINYPDGQQQERVTHYVVGLGNGLWASKRGDQALHLTATPLSESLLGAYGGIMGVFLKTPAAPESTFKGIEDKVPNTNPSAFMLNSYDASMFSAASEQDDQSTSSGGDYQVVDRVLWPPFKGTEFYGKPLEDLNN